MHTVAWLLRAVWSVEREKEVSQASWLKLVGFGCRLLLIASHKAGSGKGHITTQSSCYVVFFSVLPRHKSYKMSSFSIFYRIHFNITEKQAYICPRIASAEVVQHRDTLCHRRAVGLFWALAATKVPVSERIPRERSEWAEPKHWALSRESLSLNAPDEWY